MMTAAVLFKIVKLLSGMGVFDGCSHTYAPRIFDSFLPSSS
jgi:hypothetical protein